MRPSLLVSLTIPFLSSWSALFPLMTVASSVLCSSVPPALSLWDPHPFLPQQVPWQSHGAEHQKETSRPVPG